MILHEETSLFGAHKMFPTVVEIIAHFCSCGGKYSHGSGG